MGCWYASQTLPIATSRCGGNRGEAKRRPVSWERHLRADAARPGACVGGGDEERVRRPVRGAPTSKSTDVSYLRISHPDDRVAHHLPRTPHPTSLFAFGAIVHERSIEAPSRGARGHADGREQAVRADASIADRPVIAFRRAPRGGGGEARRRGHRWRQEEGLIESDYCFFGTT